MTSVAPPPPTPSSKRRGVGGLGPLLAKEGAGGGGKQEVSGRNTRYDIFPTQFRACRRYLGRRLGAYSSVRARHVHCLSRVPGAERPAADALPEVRAGPACGLTRGPGFHSPSADGHAVTFKECAKIREAGRMRPVRSGEERPKPRPAPSLGARPAESFPDSLKIRSDRRHLRQRYIPCPGP